MATRLVIRAAPGKPRSSVRGRHGGGWKVDIAAPPERGRANEELCRFLASSLGVDRSCVTVLTGTSGRDKLVEVHGLSAARIDAVLHRAVV